MSLIIEDGSGIFGANSYVGTGFVRDYLTVRERKIEWNDATQDMRKAACVSATDYIDKRFGKSFLGEKLYKDFTVFASNIIQFTSIPTNGVTITVGSVTYTFRVSASTANEITIGSTISATAKAFVDAIEGVGGGSGTVANPQASGTVLAASEDVILRARVAGILAAPILTSTNSSNIIMDYDRLIGGSDLGEQTLEFPRTCFQGIPLCLKQATAEYAQRALSVKLMPDPETDSSGNFLLKTYDKVGPIETARDYVGGSGKQIFVKYPEADRLLLPLISSVGGVIR